MDPIPRIKSVMTPFPWSIGIDARLTDAEDMMARHGIRHLPVIDGERLVGVISDRDIHRALHASRGARSADDLAIRDIRIGEAYIVDLTERLDRVLLKMADRHLDSALVVKGGRLAGIFTGSDACRCFGEYLRSLGPPGPGDDAA